MPLDISWEEKLSIFCLSPNLRVCDFEERRSGTRQAGKRSILLQKMVGLALANAFTFLFKLSLSELSLLFNYNY
jgi:hypothetical protein